MPWMEGQMSASLCQRLLRRGPGFRIPLDATGTSPCPLRLWRRAHSVDPGPFLGSLAPESLSLCKPTGILGPMWFCVPPMLGENILEGFGFGEASNFQISAVPHTGKQKSLPSRCCDMRHVLIVAWGLLPGIEMGSGLWGVGSSPSASGDLCSRQCFIKLCTLQMASH